MHITLKIYWCCQICYRFWNRLKNASQKYALFGFMKMSLKIYIYCRIYNFFWSRLKIKCFTNVSIITFQICLNTNFYKIIGNWNPSSKTVPFFLFYFINNKIIFIFSLPRNEKDCIKKIITKNYKNKKVILQKLLLPKVLFNHFWKCQFVVLRCQISNYAYFREIFHFIPTLKERAHSTISMYF